jgi:hypothetical protein
MGRKRYSVHLSPFAAGPDRDALFVKEGFAWGAFAFGPLWALFHRLWWPAAGMIAAIAAIAAAEALLPLPPDAATPLWLGLSLVFGFEGNDWRREGLAARGYVERGPASGADLAEAELRWFAGAK